MYDLLQRPVNIGRMTLKNRCVMPAMGVNLGAPEGGVTDDVELHAAHGYLINEFLSPAMNARTDEYGGSFDNRMRFAREILEGIRRRCGRNFPVSVRINAEEDLPGGVGLEGAVKIADAINVSCYSNGCIEPGTYEQGWKKYMAEAVKRAVKIPVIAVCNVKDPAAADSLIAQIRAAGVEVRLNEKATPETVAALNPCGVFLACGAEPVIPNIEGVRGKNVCTAEDVLLKRVKINGSAAVIGSGMTGLETAEMLALDGCKLTLVEMLDSFGPGMYPSVVDDVMNRITPHNPKILTGHKLVNITPEGAELLRLSDNAPVFVQVDHVILSLGVCPRASVAEASTARFPNVQVIGDARRGGRILEATQDAHGRAFTFEP